MLKNLQNRHTREIKTAKSNYYKSQYKTNLGKWKTLREDHLQEDKGLSSAKIDGKLFTSQKILAEKYSEAFLKKLEDLKQELPANNILAEENFKELIPRNENNLEFKEVK